MLDAVLDVFRKETLAVACLQTSTRVQPYYLCESGDGRDHGRWLKTYTAPVVDRIE